MSLTHGDLLPPEKRPRRPCGSLLQGESKVREGLWPSGCSMALWAGNFIGRASVLTCMSPREVVRRLVPREVRLRYALWRRAWADRHVVFAGPGPGEGLGVVVAQYAAPIRNYPGQERFFEAKVHNMRLLAAALDGVVIGPGQTFSLWRSAGRPTAKRGYREGAAYRRRKVVSEVGGSTCLVSTVVYNAALLAGLEIVERHGHSIDPYGANRYWELGRDATVEYGYLDLRFRNAMAGAVRLRVGLGEGCAQAAIEAGEPSGACVELVVGEPEYLPPGTVVTIDPYLPPGTTELRSAGAPGCRVRTWRRFRGPGGEERLEDLGVTVHHPMAVELAKGPG